MTGEDQVFSGKYEEIRICDECGSAFIASASKMMGLCPECASILYGYENCDHVFEDGVCVKCLWDGSRSDYIRWLLTPEETPDG